jgi:glycosyltransferase involved in cell wall biosynthesis
VSYDLSGKEGTNLQIVASLSLEGGGPSYSVPSLARSLACHIADVKLLTLGEKNLSQEDYLRDTFPRTPLPILSNLAWSNPLRSALDDYASKGAVIHTHGLWLMPNIYPSWAIGKNPSSNAKLVHSPRGMLGEAARRISSWKKEPIWWLWQRKALMMADCLHATAESEFEEIRRAGLGNPVAIIPNGIDLPPIGTIPNRLSRQKRHILSLGRIHPKKGLDRLLQAWAQIEPRAPNWSLKFVGNAEVGHDLELLQLAKKLGVERFSLEWPRFGAEKWQAFQDADMFVLPTLNENFAITVAEALASQLPVISTKGAPWSGLETHRCGWWIDHGPEPMAQTLLTAINMLPQERANMGARGRAWMGRDFGWPAIGTNMAAVYRWLKLGGEPPPCVRFN